MVTVKISNIVTDPAGFDRLMDKQGRYLGPFTKLNEEYVELYNDSNDSADVSFWYITDSKGHRYVFVSPNTTIGPHKTLTLHTGSGIDVTDKLGQVCLY